jgi:hypothetical protein
LSDPTLGAMGLRRRWGTHFRGEWGTQFCDGLRDCWSLGLSGGNGEKQIPFGNDKRKGERDGRGVRIVPLLICEADYGAREWCGLAAWVASKGLQWVSGQDTGASPLRSR